ncbi:fibrinogen-binding protein isoform X2 [Magallana gigas]|uniref:fibrinogen-binding protein isoform X2 n=1 Tax=Magallana gigas TaxID=29159 RepID=UPI0033402675
MAANNERRFSLADFIRSERVKRNENEIEDFKTKKSSDEKQNATSIHPSNDGSTEKEEISALYPVRVKRHQARHRRHSEFHDASRKSITEDMVDKNLCGVVTDEDDTDHSPSTKPRAYYKRRRRFSVIQDNEGSSFTMEDKIRALQEEGGAFHKRNGRSGKSHRTNRSTISPFPSSAHSRSTSGSVMFWDRHESASVNSETQREMTPKKNTSENEKSKVVNTEEQNEKSEVVNEGEQNNDDTIKVEIRRGSSRTKNIVVSLQVGDTTQELEEKDANNCNVETYQSRISIESRHREGLSNSGITNSTDKMSSQISIAKDEKNIEIKNHEQDESKAKELSNNLQDSCLSKDESNKETFSEDSTTSRNEEKIENMKSSDKISVNLESAKMQEEDEMTRDQPQNSTSVASGFDKMTKEDNIQNVDLPNMVNVTIDPGKQPDAQTVELRGEPSVSNFDKSKTDKNMEPHADDNIDNGIPENTSPRESNELHNIGILQDVDVSSSNSQVNSSECREENEVLNVEPIYKSKAEVNLSNQNDTEETNNYITNGYETNGISNKEFWNPETGNDENKEKSYEGMSKNVKVSISDAPKTDMDDITSEEIASRVHQPIPQTTVNLLKSSNKQQEAIKFSESKVIESDDTTWIEADRQGVILGNGSKSTVSHKHSSESTRDGEVEEETDEQKSKSNQSRARYKALEAKTNNPENKATSSMHEEQISVGVHTSETDKRLHVTEKPRVTTLTIDDSKTEKRTGAKNPTSLSQMSLDVRAHNANLYKKPHREAGSSDPDRGSKTSQEQNSSRRATAISATTHTGRDDDKQEHAKQRNGKKMTQNEELNGSRENVYEKNVFNRDTVQDENPINDSIKDCNKNGNMDTDDKKDPRNDCNNDLDKENGSLDDCNMYTVEKDSLNSCNKDKNEEKKQLDGCNQDEDNENDSLDDCNQETNNGKNSFSDCNKDINNEKDSLDDFNKDTDKEKDSLKDCDQDANRNKDSLKDCDQDTNNTKYSLNDCDQDTNNKKDSLNDCNQDSNGENDSLDDCKDDADKEKESLKDCTQDTSNEKDSLNKCAQNTDNEKDSLNDCDQDTEKEQLNDCIQDTDKENDSQNDCDQDTNNTNYSKKDFEIERDSLNDCNMNTDREKALQFNDCNQDTNKEKDSLKDCDQDTNSEKDSLDDCKKDTNEDSLIGCNQDTGKENEKLNGCNRDMDEEQYKLKQNASKEKVQLNEYELNMNKENILPNDSSRDTNAKVLIDDSIQDTNDGTVLTDDNQAESITSGSEGTQIGISEYEEPYHITKPTDDNGLDSVQQIKRNDNCFSNQFQHRQCIQDNNQNDIQEDDTKDLMRSNQIPLKRLPMAERFIENYTEQDKEIFNEAMNPKHVSKSQTSSLPKIEIVIKNDDTHRENDVTLVIKLPQNGTRTRETSYVKSMKDQFCQTDGDSQRGSTRPQEALPQFSCEPPLLQSKERSFIRLHHKPSREPEPDPEVLYFIKQAELRQRRRIDDIMREIYQIKHVDLLESPMCSCPEYMYPGSRDHHPRFLYDSDPYDSVVVKAAQYNDSVRRFLGYTKRSDRLKAMEHSRKYKAYLDLRKKLKHLY